LVWLVVIASTRTERLMVTHTTAVEYVDEKLGMKVDQLTFSGEGFLPEVGRYRQALYGQRA
jgi:hypothetical protein